MKCNKCGTENPKGKNVCTKCGAFLYSSNPNNRVPLTKKQKRERIIKMIKGSAYGCLLTTLALIAMLIILGVFSYIFVRFIMPDDLLEGIPIEDMSTQESPQNNHNSIESTADSYLQTILDAFKTV